MHQSFFSNLSGRIPKGSVFSSFSFLFASTPLMNSSHFTALNAKSMSITKICTTSQRSEFQTPCFYTSTAYSSLHLYLKKNLKPQCVKIELLFATGKLSQHANFSFQLVQNQLLRQQFWSYPWLHSTLCHIPHFDLTENLIYSTLKTYLKMQFFLPSPLDHPYVTTIISFLDTAIASYTRCYRLL